MQRIRSIALVVGAALILGAVASATASAVEPEWQQGGKGISGPIKFTGTTGAGLLETAGGTQVKCSGGSSEGQIEGEKASSKTTVSFTGCKLVGGGECKTVGDNKEEIKTKSLKGVLGYLEKATKKVGEKLEPEEAGGLYAKFVCLFFGEVTEEVKGAVIGQVKPVDVEQATGELIFKQTPKGKQEWKKFEGGAEMHLECSKLFGGFEECAVESTTEVKWAGGAKVEVKG